jgi:gluconate 2-dehydrogenase gamma chain
MHPYYPTNTVRALLDTDQVTDATRQALVQRLQLLPHQPTFFSVSEFALLQAVCNRLVPQDNPSGWIDMASNIDKRLSEHKYDGWRYDTMPPDEDAYRLGLMGIEESTQLIFQQGFRNISAEQQDFILKAVQLMEAPGDIWKKLPADRFFEELLTEVTENYYSHPLAQEEIGYVGMADIPAWHRIGLNQLEDREPKRIG